MATCTADLVAGRRLTGLMVVGRLVGLARGFTAIDYRTPELQHSKCAPVLFMRGDNGRLFEIERPTEQQLLAWQIDALASETHAVIDARRYDIAIDKLLGIKELMAP
jgi:hypothetical protein